MVTSLTEKGMTESIAYELRKQKRLTGCVTVKLRYSDGETHHIQKTISYCNSDHLLLNVAKTLFKKLYTRRLLIWMPGIKFTNLIPGSYQIDLFADNEATIKLYQSIDAVKSRFGEGLLSRASSI